MGSFEDECDKCQEIKHIRSSYECQICGYKECNDCCGEWTEICTDCEIKKSTDCEIKESTVKSIFVKDVEKV
jgi:uncharacterized Fe-S cluster-containing protein